MEYYKVTVQLGGEQLNALVKTVSVAEIPILERIHGAGSVLIHRLVGERKIESSKELRRLEATYTAKLDGKEMTIVDELYKSGVTPSVPMTLAQIGDRALVQLIEGKANEDNHVLEDNDFVGSLAEMEAPKAVTTAPTPTSTKGQATQRPLLQTASA